MTDYPSKLKPCPFCGNKATLSNSTQTDNGADCRTIYTVSCLDRDCNTVKSAAGPWGYARKDDRFKTLALACKEVIRLWNMRMDVID